MNILRLYIGGLLVGTPLATLFQAHFSWGGSVFLSALVWAGILCIASSREVK